MVKTTRSGRRMIPLLTSPLHRVGVDLDVAHVGHVELVADLELLALHQQVGHVDGELALLDHVPKAEGLHRAPLHVGPHHVGGGEPGDDHLAGDAKVLRRLGGAGEGVGVGADHRVEVGVGLEEGGRHLHRLLGVLVAENGVHDHPVGVALGDDLLGHPHPLVLVGDGGARVVEGDLLGPLVRVVHLVGGHLHEQLAELLRRPLADVEGAVARVDVGVPGEDDHALTHRPLQRLVQAVGGKRRDRDGVVALVDEVVDVLDLAGDAGGVGPVVLDVDAELLAHLHRALAAGLEEPHPGELGDEGDLDLLLGPGAAREREHQRHGPE